MSFAFGYRTHEDLYVEYRDLDINLDSVSTTRQNFIATIARLDPRQQSAVLQGILERFPPDEDGVPTPRRTLSLRFETSAIPWSLASRQLAKRGLTVRTLAGRSPEPKRPNAPNLL